VISAIDAAGLIVDAVGATVLVLGAALKRPWQATDEATPKYGYNAALDVALAKQTADAQVGAALLVAGFAAQLVAALGWTAESCLALALALAAAAILSAASILFLLLVWRPRRGARAMWSRLAGTQVDDWPNAIHTYARELGKFKSEGGRRDASRDRAPRPRSVPLERSRPG
jgi:hypothetical protein